VFFSNFTYHRFSPEVAAPFRLIVAAAYSFVSFPHHHFLLLLLLPCFVAIPLIFSVGFLLVAAYQIIGQTLLASSET